MTANQVTRRQARIVNSKIIPMRSYLFELKTRMADRGFSSGDPLFDLVSNALEAVGELYVDLAIRQREGPTSLPERPKVEWLDRRSARKQRDEMR